MKVESKSALSSVIHEIINENDVSEEVVYICDRVLEDAFYANDFFAPDLYEEESFEEVLTTAVNALSDGEYLSQCKFNNEEDVNSAFDIFEKALKELSFGYYIFNQTYNRAENIPELDKELDKIGYSERLSNSIWELLENNNYFDLERNCSYEVREFEYIRDAQTCEHGAFVFHTFDK